MWLKDQRTWCVHVHTGKAIWCLLNAALLCINKQTRCSSQIVVAYIRIRPHKHAIHVIVISCLMHLLFLFGHTIFFFFTSPISVYYSVAYAAFVCMRRAYNTIHTVDE